VFVLAHARIVIPATRFMELTGHMAVADIGGRFLPKMERFL
jgi:hypothetical protein